MADRLSVAIVSFNSADCIGSCVESVARCLPGAEIIVVDNGSADGSLEVARHASTDVQGVVNPGNIGFGRACNQAARIASEGHVLFLNPDTRLVSVDQEAIGKVLLETRFGLRVGVLTAAGEQRPLLRREPSMLSEVLHHAAGPLRPRELVPRSTATRGSRWAAAALILLRRGEFLELGGFDPRFFLYYEDRELSARYRDAGLPIESLPGMVGVHRGGGSSGADPMRAGPVAWEYLSWLEYVGLRCGRSRAWMAWQLTRGPRTAARALTRVIAECGVGGRRLAAKAEQLDAVARCVAVLAEGDRGGDEEPAFCPVARRLVGAGWR